MTEADAKIIKLKSDLESMMYSDYHIHAGVTREVVAKP